MRLWTIHIPATDDPGKICLYASGSLQHWDIIPLKLYTIDIYKRYKYDFGHKSWKPMIFRLISQKWDQLSMDGAINLNLPLLV